MAILHVLATLYLIRHAAAIVVKTDDTPNATDKGNFELLILHNNDMHARFEQTSQLSGTCTPADRDAGKCYGGFPRVAYVVKKARAAAAAGEGPPVLYLNAGDTYTGTAWFTIYKWKIAAEFINALQPDAVSLGNHEFDNGVAGLTPFIKNVTCPVLAANLILNKEPELSVLLNLMKSKVFDINNTSIGVIGYLTPETKFLAVGNNVEYVDEIEAITQEVAKLKERGVKILIALGHSGFTKDKEIAKEVDGLDLVIGGHTNTFLWNGSVIESEGPEGPYPTFIKQSSGRIVPVVQAYAYTKYLGQLRLIFDLSGEAISIDGSPILLDNSIPQDEDVLKIIHHYQDGVSRITEQIIGNTSILLDGATCQRHECNLGNMIADAMVLCYAYNYKGDYWTDTAIGIIQAGGIRSSLQSEDITMGDLIAVMPFESNLAIVEVTGSILLEMLEHAISNYDSQNPPGEFLQFSGIRVVYDLKKPPSRRVVAATARCWMCDFPRYNNIELETQYKIILPSFLADGGNGYKMLKAMPRIILPYNELKCTTDYVQKHSPVFPETDGRIQFLQDNLGSDSIFVTASRTIVLCSLLLNYITKLMYRD